MNPRRRWLSGRGGDGFCGRFCPAQSRRFLTALSLGSGTAEVFFELLLLRHAFLLLPEQSTFLLQEHLRQTQVSQRN